MPWTAKQEAYMKINHPDVARRVMSEPGYKTKPELPQARAASFRKQHPKKGK